MKAQATPQGTRREWRLAAALAAACAALLLLLLPAATSRAQTKKPITKDGLVKAVKINGLSTTELVQHVERRGVDFQMTSATEQELQAVGARPEIIETARANYRPAVVAAPAVARPAPRPATPSSAKPSAPVPPGPPLSKNEIVTMLQGGIAPARVEQFVEVRGVSFSLTPDITREINAAGGTRSLIGAITERAAHASDASPSYDGSPGSPSYSRPPANAGPDYDDYIDRVQALIAASDAYSAIRLAQDAVQLDPSRPTAYTLLGFAQLYGKGDILAAEQAMRAAIERGGSASFIVAHDHDGNFNQFCVGSFFVTKTGVSFKANDGRDTFETTDANIKEAKTNSWVGLALGAFHVKPVQKINNRDNFNFAPASRQKAESQLILRLMKDY